MFSVSTTIALILIAVLGHIMALTWYLAASGKWKICERKIYDLPVDQAQIARETRNSIHAPIHAVLLAIFVYAGFFGNDTAASFLSTLVLTTAWAEIWHYASHRAFHTRPLHWIHLEHHRSQINTWMTAISFSFPEKVIFDLGLLLPLALLDTKVSLNFLGIAGWYIGYLVINSFSHANFELKPKHFNQVLGKVITSTTYHSLHHSRYTGNYGLGTRVLDRLLRTEWPDYEIVYDKVSSERTPLKKLKEKFDPTPGA
jgi:sterol desaturase/sphingolipid hydroxylase (fatty acid hydroxylase superfamily)